MPARAESSAPTSIAPLLSVRRGREAIDFYRRAFGAVERFRVDDDAGEVIARLDVLGASFWVADESPANGNYSPDTVGGSTTRMILTVEDPDAVVASAIAAGATEVWPVADRYGWRLGRVVDPYGHHWEIGRPDAEDRGAGP